MLGTSNGNIALYMDGGRISRALMELVGLDLLKYAQVRLKGDEPVEVRCAIADMTVKDGLATINALVIDTSVVNIQGGGWINLKNEEMNLTIDPKRRRDRHGGAESTARRDSPDQRGARRGQSLRPAGRRGPGEDPGYG
jgi:uncharacterized protein involved in outer membrane biogenesis